MPSSHVKSLPILRFDQTTFAGKPRWREIRFEHELRARDVATFLNGEAAGPAVLVLEESAFERFRLVACEKGSEVLVRDFGCQHVTERTGQTTSLHQELGSAHGPVTLLTRYVDAKRVPGAVKSFLRKLLKNDEPPRHLYIIGVAKDVWDYLEVKAGPLEIEDPVWSVIRGLYRGASAIAERARQDAFEAAKSTLSTLIIGETGTGKSLLAQCIHVGSGRRGPFVAVNCSALAPTVEAEIFGYEVGAFTGATVAKAGMFERANRGTLFLDEIGFLPLEDQAKFLCILEAGEVTRMGSTKPIPFDVKLVTATNGNLRAKIDRGQFLPELIARLDGVRIRIPALRDRRADIPDLIEAFWPGAVTGGYLAAPLLEILKQYDWPLNVRQLRKVTIRLRERAALGPEPTRDFLLERLAEDEELTPSRTFSFAGTQERSSVAIARALDAYDAVRSRYERLAHVFRTVVESVVHDMTHIGTVLSHTMTRAELAERLHDPDGDACRIGFGTDADRCVVTVMVLTPNQKRDVYLELKHYFELQGDTSPEHDEDFTSAMMRPWSYVARIDGRGARRLRRLGVPLPSEVVGLEGRLELRTVLEDLEATVQEQFMAAGVTMPASWRAKLREQKGPLSLIQQTLEVLCHQFKSLTGSYGTYVSDEEVRRKLDALRRTLAVAPDVDVAARAGKLAVVLGDWPVAIDILQPYASTKNARVLRELGAALCKRYDPRTREYQTGIAYLEQACRRAPHDPDACARLAGALRRSGDVKRARRSFERALEIDPANPYALSGLIHTTLMLNRDADVIARMKDAIDAATQRCRERVTASVDMPWALLDLGKFLLLAGNVREGLEAYARAIGRTTAPWMLSTTMRSLSELGEYPSVPRELAVAERMLAIGSALRFRSEDAAGRVPSRRNPRRNVRGPVVMLVEAGDGLQDDRRPALAEIVEKGLAGFCGTAMVLAASGSTGATLGEDGDAPLVPTARTIRYHGGGATGDESASGAGGMAIDLDPWADVAASRLSPSQVLVLVLGEEARVSVECRLARGVGAQVAVVPVDDEGETLPEGGDGDLPVVRDPGALSELVAALG